MEVYSLFDLNQYIKQVVALNFVDALWISCEISQINESRGHCYLELVEKDEVTDQVKARVSAVIWFREYTFIRKKLGALVDKVLQDGMQVKLKVEVDFHERYGMKLIIKDIDPAFTYGQLAIQREKIIEQLRVEQRMERNKNIYFPSVVQRCAVISSDTAAGYQDLIQHLNNNEYGYAFESQLFPAAMQGARTEMEVVSQLREINAQKDTFQIVIITRGGGSKLDLAAFDSYSIAKQISEMSIPVLVGIGHDIDLSIADMVSALSLKTPTAVANFLVDHNASFESSLYDLAINIKLKTQERFNTIKQYLANALSVAEQVSKNRIGKEKERLSAIESDLPIALRRRLGKLSEQLKHYQTVNKLIHPDKLLEKGYSMSYADGKLITSSKQVKEGDVVTTQLKDGNITSTVNKQ